MEVVVTSRHMSVPGGFAEHATEKLTRLNRHDRYVDRVEVEIDKERNPRLAAHAVKVEVAVRSRGQLLRATGCGPNPLAALDEATARATEQLRRAVDRRRVHHGRHSPPPLVAALSGALAGPDAAG